MVRNTLLQIDERTVYVAWRRGRENAPSTSFRRRHAPESRWPIPPCASRTLQSAASGWRGHVGSVSRSWSTNEGNEVRGRVPGQRTVGSAVSGPDEVL